MKFSIEYSAPKNQFVSSISEESQQFIEKNWQTLLERRPKLFNSVLLRVELPVICDQDDCVIKVIPDITYKDVVSLRYGTGDVPREVPEKDSFLSLSCYIFIKTSDEHLLMFKRDDGDWDVGLDMSGGFIAHKYAVTNVTDFARIRACEDMNIDEMYVAKTTCIGTYESRDILEYMTVCVVELNVTLDEVRKISPTTSYVIPFDYVPSKHFEYFDIRVHEPLKPIIERFIAMAREA